MWPEVRSFASQLVINSRSKQSDVKGGHSNLCPTPPAALYSLLNAKSRFWQKAQPLSCAILCNRSEVVVSYALEVESSHILLQRCLKTHQAYLFKKHKAAAML